MPSVFQAEHSEWTLFFAVLLGLFVAEQVGWRLGRRHRNEQDDAARSQVGTLQGAVLGLLALLLGFSFSMAALRFDTRRSLVREEANAIGTAYLRAAFVAEPERGQIRQLLVRYVDTRVEFYAVRDVPQQRIVDRHTEQLHAALWQNVVSAAERDPRPTTALLAAALNDVIDLHTTRLSAVYNHVPLVILWLLLGVAALGCALTGFASGLTTRRYPLPTAIVLVLITAVVLVIIDLDRPRRGLIQSGQKSMLDLQRSLAQTR